MAFTGQPVYCTVEDVRTSVDSNATSYNDSQIQRLVSAAANSIEGQLGRFFYPIATTKYWTWPSIQNGRSWRLWLDKNELISLTSEVTGGITVTADQFFLEPQQYGPPYRCIEFNLTSTYAFGGGSTPQRDVAITGVFGFTNATTAAGTLTAAISSVSATTASVSDSSQVGVGDTILLDGEYCQITKKSYVTSG